MEENEKLDEETKLEEKQPEKKARRPKKKKYEVVLVGETHVVYRNTLGTLSRTPKPKGKDFKAGDKIEL